MLSWPASAQLNLIYFVCLVRGHVQTIFGKINVIMTLRGGGGGGGVECDANFFVCVLLSFCQLFLQDFAAIMPIIL